MDKPWLKTYPKDVPPEIDSNQYGTLTEIFDYCFSRYQDSVAFANMGVELSYSEVDILSKKLAVYLQKHPSLNTGDRVAVMMPNILQYPIVIMAILRAGMIVVNVNPLYTSRELSHQLKDSGAKAIVVLENFAKTVSQSLDNSDIELVVVTKVGDHFPTLKKNVVNFVLKYIKKAIPSWEIRDYVNYKDIFSDSISNYQKIDISSDSIAFLQYTGGTTGLSKGAMLTHKNIITNICQLDAWTKPIHKKGDIIVTPLPLYHIFSLSLNLFLFMYLGAYNLLITNPKDIPSFVKELKKYSFSYITGVNTLYAALLRDPGFKDIDFRNLKLALGGGMAVQRETSEQWKNVTGKPIVQGYGLTETSPVVSATLIDATDFNGAAGLPIPSTEVKIVDNKGNSLPVNEVGEICIKGPQVMKGYWNNPEATQKAISIDGWFHSGDLGHIDEDGYLYIDDRLTDMIIVSGFNVYPSEIEDFVITHPDIIEVAAIGIPDPDSGEAIKLFVVTNDESLTSKSIIDYCRKGLTGYKIPQSIEFCKDLPKTNVGKILKRALKES